LGHRFSGRIIKYPAFTSGMDVDELARHWSLAQYRTRKRYPDASAEDVAQEAYCATVRYLEHRPAPVEAYPALLWTVAKRLARRRRLAPVQLDYLPAGAWPAAQTPEPWQVVSAAETRSSVERYVDILSPTKAALVRGYYFEGKSCGQLAAELGLSRSGVKTTLHRARKDLRKALGVEEDDG
jgi:RNA polymerase sigma factor (sigma-70 family)